MTDMRSRGVLITGCSSGIGRATALHLARGGWTVYATARRPDTLGDLAQAGCHTLALDLEREETMRATVAEVERRHGGVGALVNNAGYSQSGAVEEITPGQVLRQFQTNVFGPVRLTQLTLPGMRRLGRGRVIFVGSMGGRLTFPGGGVYHATKHALEAVADALRFEVAGFGIDVTLVQPGLIRTSFGRTAVDTMRSTPHAGDHPYADFDREVARITREVYEKGALAALAGTAEDVARAIEKVLRARRPPPRVKVSASAHVLMRLRTLLGDRGWDGFLGRHYPRPGTPAA